MRQVLNRVMVAVPVVAGTAEAMPVRAGSLDAVCVAQGCEEMSWVPDAL